MQTIATDRQKQKGLFDSAAGVTSLLCRNLSVQRVSTCAVPTTGEEQIVFRVRELCSDVSFSFITFVFIYIVPNYNTKVFSAGLTVYYDLFFLSWWRNYILCWASLIKLVRNVSNDPRTTAKSWSVVWKKTITIFMHRNWLWGLQKKNSVKSQNVHKYYRWRTSNLSGQNFIYFF